MDPFEAGKALNRPAPSGHMAGADRTRKHKNKIRLNVAIHHKIHNTKEKARKAERFHEGNVLPLRVRTKMIYRKAPDVIRSPAKAI